MTSAPLDDERGAVTNDYRTSNRRSNGSPRATASSLNLSTRSAEMPRTGHAVGGHVVARTYAAEAFRCGCCRCRIVAGETYFEVLVGGEYLLDVCVDCVGGVV